MRTTTRNANEDCAPSARTTLTQALASESRGALARVELAASELERSGLAPALAARVSTIRAAVAELDGLLGKIDLLSDPERVPAVAKVDFARVASAVVERLRAGLRARGVEVVWGGQEEHAEGLEVAVPRPTVELLSVGLVRLVVGAVAPQGSTDDLRIAPGAVVLSVTRRGDDVCLVARCEGKESSPRFDRTARLELEVVLAEWSGAFLVGDDVRRIEVGFALPASDGDSIEGGASERASV